jgi:transcriptional regulator with XRE-family HTH domain
MRVQAHAAQVHRASFTDEIADAISFSTTALYRFAVSIVGSALVIEIFRDQFTAFALAEGGGPPMATGPTVRRRRLGTELRRLRDSSGFKLEEVAAELGVAPSTLSRIETGKAPTKSAYLSQMLEMYGVADFGQRQVLVEMAREGHRKGWWAAYDDVLPSGFDIYVGLEAETAAIRSYEISVVPGLLQTPGYAHAVLREMFPRHTPEQIDRLVDLRMVRQHRLDDEPPLELWAILDEAVIRRVVGGPGIMLLQLSHLLTNAERPSVTMQILPFSCGAHAAHGGPFSILEFPDRTDSEVAYVESVAGYIYLEKERDVRARSEAFNRLRAAALSPSASAELIAEVAGSLA